MGFGVVKLVAPNRHLIGLSMTRAGILPTQYRRGKHRRNQGGSSGGNAPAAPVTETITYYTTRNLGVQTNSAYHLDPFVPGGVLNTFVTASILGEISSVPVDKSLRVYGGDTNTGNYVAFDRSVSTGQWVAYIGAVRKDTTRPVAFTERNDAASTGIDEILSLTLYDGNTIDEFDPANIIPWTAAAAADLLRAKPFVVIEDGGRPIDVVADLSGAPIAVADNTETYAHLQIHGQINMTQFIEHRDVGDIVGLHMAGTDTATQAGFAYQLATPTNLLTRNTEWLANAPTAPHYRQSVTYRRNAQGNLVFYSMSAPEVGIAFPTTPDPVPPTPPANVALFRFTSMLPPTPHNGGADALFPQRIMDGLASQMRANVSADQTTPAPAIRTQWNRKADLVYNARSGGRGTQTAATGPGSNNPHPFFYFESSGATTAAHLNRSEFVIDGGTAGANWNDQTTRSGFSYNGKHWFSKLNLSARRLEIVFNLSSADAQKSLSIQQLGAPVGELAPPVISTTTFQSWGYGDAITAGTQLTDAGGNTFACHADGGWRQVFIDIDDLCRSVKFILGFATTQSAGGPVPLVPWQNDLAFQEIGLWGTPTS